MYEDDQWAQALTSRFSDAAPADVVRMWEKLPNEAGHSASLKSRHWQSAGTRSLPRCRRSAIRHRPRRSPLSPMAPPPTMRDVVKITTMSKTTIKRWVSDNDNDFPKPVKLSPRRIGWRKKDVVAWLEQRR